MENHSHIMAEVGGSNPPISTIAYRMKNSYSLLGYSFRWQWHSVGEQYLIAGYLDLFNEAPDKRLSLC